MKIIDNTASPFYLRNFGSGSGSAGSPNVILGGTGAAPSLCFRNAAASFAQVVSDPANSALAFDSTGGFKWRSALNQESSTLMVVNSNGNVGVATTTPRGRLSVDKNTPDISLENDYALRVTDGTGDTGLLLGVNAAGHFALIQALYPDYSWYDRPLCLMPRGGNVGIGTTVPSAVLDVSGGIFGSKTGQAYNIERSAGLSLTNGTRRVDLGYDTNLDAAFLWSYHAGQNSKNLVINPTGGNVGIGTTTPAYRLDVAGTGRLTGLLDVGALLSVAGGIALTNNGPNVINFGTSGFAPPSTTLPRSNGTKLVLYDGFAAGAGTDYGFGIDASVLWSSVPANNSSFFFRWYGGSNVWMSLSGGNLTVAGSLSLSGTLVAGSSALATGATDGFVNIPSMNGAPTGTPTAYGSTVPMVYNTASNRLCIYNGGWNSVELKPS